MSAVRVVSRLACRVLSAYCSGMRPSISQHLLSTHRGLNVAHSPPIGLVDALDLALHSPNARVVGPPCRLISATRTKMDVHPPGHHLS